MSDDLPVIGEDDGWRRCDLSNDEVELIATLLNDVRCTLGPQVQERIDRVLSKFQ